MRLRKKIGDSVLDLCGSPPYVDFKLPLNGRYSSNSHIVAALYPQELAELFSCLHHFEPKTTFTSVLVNLIVLAALSSWFMASHNS
uniref:Protein kinase domain-containing protein n=1 Tax=Steinernema glaseri TaxID=37863 RepID=A0A1I7YES3_9BILA